MAPSPVDLRSEARLYVEWVRGALGRFAVGDGVPDADPVRGVSGGPGERVDGVDQATRTSIASPPGSPFPSAVARHTDTEGHHADARSAAANLTTSRAQEVVIGLRYALSDDSTSSAGLESLRTLAIACRRCPLCESRTQVVFGEGFLRPRLMVIGEAPGADEDATGRPFVGKAGQLLTRMLAAIGLGREDVYIANVLKCRPPDNRPPAPAEIAACKPFLKEQVERLQPELLLLLGNHATRAVLATDRGITSLRGRLASSPEGWRTLATFHPAYLLRNPDAKREAWADLLLAASTLGLPVPGRAPPVP